MRLCLALSLLALPLLSSADEKQLAPNALTQKEIADGWLSLFDGETTFGWKIDGEAKVVKGVLVLGGTKATKAETTTSFHYGTTRIEANWKGDKPPSILFPTLAGLDSPPGRNELHSRKNRSTAVTCVRKSKKPEQVLVVPESLLTSVKEEMLSSSTGIAMKGPAQASPLAFDVPAGTVLELRLVRHHPDLDATLFNGKDLTGWKLFAGDAKREKSKFTVTKEGWLNVKDGPGDLATVAKYDDFVLQLECISNGKHLNSGVFFRALPGEYQMGYEAQIRNEFKDAPQKYQVEEYDPKTNKLTGKKEVLSPAFDFGTGAIYRRVPARKQASKDGEWFSMTLVARGRHFATWVNGVQQVDWTDDRPAAKKSGRDGYYGEAGCLSIQGHDPTTDLSFRNVRVAPLARR